MARAKQEIADKALRADLIELIETVIIYTLSRLSRKEVQSMLQVHDIRETRVYQEAKAEGMEEGIQQGLQQGVQEGIQEGIQRERQRLISKMAAGNLSAERIAELLGLDEETVRKHTASYKELTYAHRRRMPPTPDRHVAKA